MNPISRLRNTPAHWTLLNTLHVLNDGYLASFMLLLAFIAQSSHLNLAQVGVLGTVLNIASLTIVVPSSTIAARLGNIKTLAVALFVYTLAFLGASVASNYGLLITMFALGGLGFGVFHPIAFGLVAKWSPKETLGQAMGNFTAIGDVGRIGISAALSFMIVYLGWRHTTILYVAVALIAGTALYLYMKRHSDRVVWPEHEPKQKLSARQILKNPRYLYAVAADALDTFASDSLYIFLPFLLLERGIDPALLGSFTAAFFFGTIFGKTALGRIADKLGNGRVFIGAQLLMAAFIFLLANSSIVWLIVVCAIILGIFTKGTVPVQKSMIADSVEHHGNYDKAFSMAGFATDCTKLFAPITLGFIASAAGIVWAFNAMAITVLVSLVPGVLFYTTRHRAVK